MATDLRKLLIDEKNCLKRKQDNVNEASSRKGFFNSVKKIGNIEALNDIGAGNIGKGLRTLASISDSIRTGDGAIPSVFGSAASSLDKSNAVFNELNIDPKSLNLAQRFSPDVANRAFAQAKNVGDLVSQGNLKFDDIPSVIQEFTEADQLIRNILTDGPDDTTPKSFQRCISPYAIDLVRYAPKYKFLFILDVCFSAPYTNMKNGEFAFVIKNSTRPNVSFEYDEVNMYNFKTKVIKRSIYDAMNMRFYDDNRNNAMNFYVAYLRAISPITNMQFQQGTNQTDILEESGMDFSNFSSGTAFTTESPIKTSVNSSSIGALQGNAKNVISSIKLHHIYDYGNKFNTYEFFNPRVIRLELDELDMVDNGNGNEVSFQFEYDAMHIIPSRDVKDQINQHLITNTSGANVGALYPIRPTFSGPSVGNITSTEFSAGSNGATIANSNERTPPGDKQEESVISNAFSDRSFNGSSLS